MDSVVKDHRSWRHFIRTAANVVRVPIAELAISIIPEAVQRAIVKEHTGVTESTRHLKHATTPHIHCGWRHLPGTVADVVCVPIAELAILITPEAVQRVIVQDYTGVLRSTRDCTP